MLIVGLHCYLDGAHISACADDAKVHLTSFHSFLGTSQYRVSVGLPEQLLSHSDLDQSLCVHHSK